MKENYRHILGASLLAMSFCALGVVSAQARPLTPEEALDQARHATQTRSFQQPMRLAYTGLSETGTPAVYVFTPSGATEGFLIASADSNAPARLAYSPTGRFDASDLPPAMQWLLEGYSQMVAAAADGYDWQSAAFAAPEGAVEPMLTTKWDQRDPYNLDLPVLGGQKCAVGCIGTAMAQLMKKHNFPEKGTGGANYILEYGSEAYQITIDYTQIPIYWNYMLDVYDETATDAQKAAVSNLMALTSSSVQTQYAPKESTATDFEAALALKNNFYYDAGMQYLMHDWVSEEEWTATVYGELAAGRPMLYCGSDGTTGHAFVCDGYSEDNLFHINWGWSGNADGYYLLTDLNPYEKGTGGGSSRDGYTKKQSIVYGIQPAKAGSVTPARMMVNDEFRLQNASYGRGSATSLTFLGGFYNYCLEEKPCYMGMQVYRDGKAAEVIDLGLLSSFEPMYGRRFFEAPTMSFPVGEYEISPVYRTAADAEWVPFYYNTRLYTNRISLNVTPSLIEGEAVASVGQIIVPAEGAAEYYSLDGRRLEKPETGICIVRQGGKVSKRVVR